ncbi:MAG: hypothetical protein RR552_08185 [Oscillospiraceae bacterium]
MKNTIFKIAISLILIFNIFSINCFAAESKTLSVKISNNIATSEIKVAVGFNNKTDICGGDFIFWYNSEKLELVSSKESKSSAIVVINNNYENKGNIVKGSFFAVDTIKNGEELLTIDFKAIKGNIVPEDFSIKEFQFYNTESELISDEKMEKPIMSFEEIKVPKTETNIQGESQNQQNNENSKGTSLQGENSESKKENSNNELSKSSENTENGENQNKPKTNNKLLITLGISAGVLLFIGIVAVMIFKKKFKKQ